MVEERNIDVWVIHRKGQNYSITFDSDLRGTCITGTF
jgi:hypothetical protein